MKKIKSFEFMINTFVGSSERKDNYEESINYRNKYLSEHNSKKDAKYLWSPIEIDNEINKFISNKDLIDIKTDVYTSHRHNNGYDDTVVIKYTIIYNEEK